MGWGGEGKREIREGRERQQRGRGISYKAYKGMLSVTF